MGRRPRSAELERVELGEALRQNEAVRALAANPLLLTILALMKRQGVLPEQRVRLTPCCPHAPGSPWNPVRGLENGTFGHAMPWKSLFKILTPLALWIHRDLPGSTARSHAAIWKRKLVEFFREKGGVPCRESLLRLSWLIYSESSLLLERGNDRYGFIHLTFLERSTGGLRARAARSARAGSAL